MAKFRHIFGKKEVFGRLLEFGFVFLLNFGTNFAQWSEVYAVLTGGKNIETGSSKKVKSP